jgi:hypothetical protein
VIVRALVQDDDLWLRLTGWSAVRLDRSLLCLGDMTVPLRNLARHWARWTEVGPCWVQRSDSLALGDRLSARLPMNP